MKKCLCSVSVISSQLDKTRQDKTWKNDVQLNMAFEKQNRNSSFAKNKLWCNLNWILLADAAEIKKVCQDNELSIPNNNKE